MTVQDVLNLNLKLEHKGTYVYRYSGIYLGYTIVIYKNLLDNVNYVIPGKYAMSISNGYLELEFPYLEDL